MMPPMNTLHVGCATQTGPQSRYWKQFNAFEIEPRVVATMKPKAAARWRASAPPGAVFVPTVPPALAAGYFTGDGLATWKRALDLADALEARTVLLHTAASFRPTRDNRERLIDFVGSHRPEGLAIAWWAEGLWESQPEDRAAVCEAAGIIPAVDPLGQDDEDEEATLPEGDVIYWRLMGRKGLTGRYTDFEIDTLLALAEERRAGHVIFTTPTMFGEARRFASLLRLARADGEGAIADEDDDDGEDEGDEDFDLDALDEDDPAAPR